MKPTGSSQHSAYIPSFDGIRGIAVVWVMLYHFFETTLHFDAMKYTRPPLLGRLFDIFFSLGWIGVPVFFALSGFLITGILYDSLDDSHFFRNFYARRTLRIFPLYYGILLLCFLLTPVLHLHWEGSWWKFLLYLQGTIPGTLVPHPYVNLLHFWTLAIEEQFYLLWPLCVFWVRDIKKLLIIAVTLSIFSVAYRIGFIHIEGSVNTFMRFYLPVNLDALFAGAIAALLLRTRWTSMVLKSGPYILAIGLFPLAIYAVTHHLELSLVDRFTFSFGFLFLAISSAGLLLSVYSQEGWLARVLSLWPLRTLGKYSYGIYIFHYITNMAAINLCAWLASLGLRGALPPLIAGFLMMAGNVVLAFASFHIYEKPFLRLKRYFVYEKQPATQDPFLEDPAVVVEAA